MPFVRRGLALPLVVLVAVAFGDAFGDERDDFGVVAVKRVEGVCHDIVLSGPPRSSGDAVDDLFVGFVVKVLVAKNSNTALRNCGCFSAGDDMEGYVLRKWNTLVTARSRKIASALGDWRAPARSRSENSEPRPGVRCFCLKASMTPVFESGPCQT